MSEAPPPYSDPKQGAPPAQPYPQQPYPQQSYPQQPYPQQPVAPQQQGSNTVIVTQPTTVVHNVAFGPNPITMNCNICGAAVTTTTEKKVGIMVWLVAGIICLVGAFLVGILWLGCCLIPFCIPDLYDVEHRCPNCKNVIGYHRRLN